jgi:hypothetical protein
MNHGWLVGSLFYDAFSVTRLYIIDDRTGMDFVGVGRGLILRYYPGIRLAGLLKTTKSLNKAGRRGRDLNPGPPEYEAGVLDTLPRCSIT